MVDKSGSSPLKSHSQPLHPAHTSALGKLSGEAPPKSGPPKAYKPQASRGLCRGLRSNPGLETFD